MRKGSSAPALQRGDDQRVLVHPIADLIPMRGDQDALSMEIAQAGQPQRPVIVYEKKILEGRVRYRAALSVGVEPEFKDWVLLAGRGDDPLDWAVRHHVASWQPNERETIRLVAAVLPSYRAMKGNTEKMLNRATGLSIRKIRTLNWLEQLGKLDKVLSGEQSVLDAGRQHGIVSERRKVALGGSSFGRGDKWDEATVPLQQYLKAWKRKDYKFTHINPSEARRRLIAIDVLITELQAARNDLADRAHDARLSLPSERRTSE